MKPKGGFTLVEILVVVVILGILAAVVIPQFTQASSEARESSLCTDLQTMRSQIELYEVQHNDALPGAGTATWIQALTGQTDIAGNVGANYGPYIQKVPTNQFNDLNTVDISGAGVIGDDSHGWDFNPTTGAFYADDSGTCTDGVTLHKDL